MKLDKGVGMRVRRSRIVQVVGLATAVAVALVGCSSGSANQKSAKSISVNYMKSGTYDAAANAMVKDFKSKSGIKVDIQAFPFATLGQKNQTDITTKTGNFDVMSVSAWDIGLFDGLSPLGSQIDGWSAKDQYIPQLLKQGVAPYANGKPVGVNYAADAYGVFVNTSLLPDAKGWTNWDDLVAYATAAKSKLPADVAPISFAFGAPEQVPGIFQGVYDGTYFNASGKWELDRAKAVHALEVIKEILALGPANAAALSIDESNALFLKGKAAITIGWPSFIRGPLNDPKQSTIGTNWKLLRFPGPGTPQLSNWALAISGLSNNKSAAWDWIKAYITPENATKWMFTYGIGSPFSSTYTDKALLAGHANDLPVQKENLDRAEPLPMTLAAFEVFYRLIGEFVAGSISADQVIDQAKVQWAALPIPAELLRTARSGGYVAK